MIPAIGWEMRFTDENSDSDKFYLIIVAGPILILNWGKFGNTGQFKVHRFDSSAASQKRALDITKEKEAKRGYREFRPVTTFGVDPAELANCHRDDQPQLRTSIVNRYLDAAPELSWQR
jgi:predicted DNA-binding WGR domain protein